jgi:flagellar basal-body rod protein FlgC
MANASTTRTENGEPYRRRYVVFQEREQNTVPFGSLFLRAKQTNLGGVRVAYIGEDQSEFKYDYNPAHPDADEDGYVRMPNVDVVQEMTDMMASYRAYEANITALNTFKDMAVKTLELGKS